MSKIKYIIYILFILLIFLLYILIDNRNKNLVEYEVFDFCTSRNYKKKINKISLLDIENSIYNIIDDVDSNKSEFIVLNSFCIVVNSKKVISIDNYNNKIKIRNTDRNVKIYDTIKNEIYDTNITRNVLEDENSIKTFISKYCREYVSKSNVLSGKFKTYEDCHRLKCGKYLFTYNINISTLLIEEVRN